MTQRSSCLSTDFPPDWDRIQGAWEDCMDYLAEQGVDPEASYALCTVVLELLENAVKYGGFPSDNDRIKLEVRTHENALTTIEVRTPLSGDTAHLRRLDRMLQWIRGFQDPFEAYVERLKEVAATPFSESETGLGLVRIAYEGQCILDFIVDDSNELAMSAVYQPRAAMPLPPMHFATDGDVVHAK